MNKISGVILTKNNERTIADCVRSLSFLIDKLIIIDDFSNDATLDIIKAEYPNAKIQQRKLNRFDEQRNYGISLTNTPWVLMIDSDEIISAELAQAIKNELESKNIDAYWSIRMNRFFSVYLKENFIDRPILFKNDLKFSHPVHETILINKNRLKKLDGNLSHENWISIEKNIEKLDKYSGLIAKKWLEQQRNYGNITLFLLAIILPIRYFFICFFKKGFYKAGFFNGLFYSLFEASYWLAVIFKYREAIKKDKTI
ncbi:MAG: glycosyltransferase family 2 protein [Patescibacteria group bacterium]